MAKEKIAVLGGGCGALAAVFALTDRKGWEQKYEITVYQRGWRLGGKGAAGRNVTAGNRIEEHGLHVWSGFYENAFWLMRKCYAELNRPATEPLATAFSAFRPRHYAGLSNYVDGEWVFWKGYLPHDAGLPGDFIDPGEYKIRGDMRSPWDMLCEVVLWSLRYLETTSNASSARAPEPAGEPKWLLDAFLADRAEPANLWEWIKNWYEFGLIGWILWQVLRAFKAARRYHDRTKKAGAGRKMHRHTDGPYRRLARRIECLHWWFHRELDKPGDRSSDKRSFFVLGDLFLAMMIGILRDGVVAHGFDVIDDRDLRDWLADHGTRRESLQNPTVDSAYCYVFAFEGGDPARPRLAAGVAIRLLLRLLLCSRGAVFWEMQGGMGDTVFAPIYEALRRRGVKFKFFHRTLEVITRDGGQIDAIRIGRQATVKTGADYRPLVDVKGLPAWPSVPDYAQLVEGEKLLAKYGMAGCDLDSAYTDWADIDEFTLERGAHFDRVVLGISLGALPFLCPTLLEHSAKFKQAVEHIKTVCTQSMQLWTTRSLDELGWQLPPPIICSYGEPFDTWADLSRLLEREDWRGPEYPASLAYFCGAMLDDAEGILAPGPNPGYDLAAYDRVKQNARGWLAQFTGELWAEGVRKGATDLDYQILHRDGGGSDAERFDFQWFSANIDPSNRYVLSLPGTTAHRMKADESGFSNLVLAGDWVRNGLNYGCVEAAVLGGLQAARAIGGYPDTLYGEHDVPADSPFARTGAPPPVRVPAPVAPAGSDEYVRRGGMDVLPAPWRCDKVEMHAFYLQADLAALQRLCDRCVNEPSRGYLNYRPSTRYVVLTFQRLDQLRSAAQGCEDQGRHSYCEAAFWVITTPHDRSGKATGGPALMIPYIFAENGLAVATGREVFGYPKEQATVQMPRSDQPADEYVVKALAVREFGAAAMAEPDTEILRCSRIDRSLLAGVGHGAREFGADLWATITGGDVAGSAVALMHDLINILLTRRIELVFLRQLRAAGGGPGCDLKAVMGAAQDPLNVKCLRLLKGRYELTLPALQSHPIAADLGLAVNDGKVDVVMGVEIDLDFVLQPARYLWPPQVV